MKTIQQVIKGLDSRELEEQYRRQYPLNIYSLEDCDALTIGVFKSYESKRFQEFLDKLKKIEPVKCEDGQGILVAHKADTTTFSSGFDVDLIFLEDLMNKEDLGKVECYDYEFTPQNVCVGFLVADTEFNKRSLMELVVRFLFEVSYHGYEQEGLEKAIRELNRASRECEIYEKMIEEGKKIPFVMRSLPDEQEEKTLEEELYDEYVKAGRRYTAFCREREYEIVKKQLIEDQNQ